MMIIIRDSMLPYFDISKTKRLCMLDYLRSVHIIEDKKATVPKFVKNWGNEVESVCFEVNESKYNIYKEFNDGGAILANTFSDGIVLLSEDEKMFYLKKVGPLGFFELLKCGGFFIEDGKNEYALSNMMKSRYAFSDIEYYSVTILPTQDCNARCFYCFEQEKKSIAMNNEIADKVVNYLVDRIPKNSSIKYTWFGGEPLLEIPIIDKIVNDVNQRKEYSLNYTSSVITNGSKLNEELLFKMIRAWHLKSIVISIDGYREEHDRRKNYIQSTDERFLDYEIAIKNIGLCLREGINVICRLNLDKNNTRDLESIFQDLLEFVEYNNFSIQLSTLHDVPGFRNNDFYSKKDLRRFYRYSYRLLKRYGFAKNPINFMPHRSKGNCAATSLNTIVIGADGNLYRCYQEIMENKTKVGDVESGISFNDNYYRWYNVFLANDSECEKCIMFPICQGGCAFYREKKIYGDKACHRTKYYFDLILEDLYYYYYAKEEE